MKKAVQRLILTCLALQAATAQAQIDSCQFAYDRLVAHMFDSEYGSRVVCGIPDRIEGLAQIETAQETITLEQGPGWLFWIAEEDVIPLRHTMAFVTEEGTVVSRVTKSPPLEGQHFERIDLAEWTRPVAKEPIDTPRSAYDRLIHGLLGHTTGDWRVYQHRSKVEGAARVVSGPERIEIDADPGWLFFIDPDPGANWAHPCAFVLVTEGGDFIKRRATWPPSDLRKYEELTTPIPEAKYRIPKRAAPDWEEPDTSMRLETTPAANKWAVIISGGGDTNVNHVRYWNDCSYFYETLMDYGFLDDHVYVLMADGVDPAHDRPDGTSSPPDLDGDGDWDIKDSATHPNITSVFDTLQTLLDGDDLLYIFTTDHGHSRDAFPHDDPDVAMTLWYSPSISDVDFAFEINKITTRATVCIFEQCNSGGMIDDLESPNRVLMSAARFWEASRSGRGIASGYDEFSYYVTTALDNVAAADGNDDGMVSMEEAYLYGLANDVCQDESINSYDQVTGEHPCYYSNPWDLGRRISLGGMHVLPDGPVYAGYLQREIVATFPSGGTPQNWKSDDSYWQFNLPFTFPYMGGNYNTVWIESNGIIHLVNPGSTCYSNSVNRLKSRRAIAPLWDDLKTTPVGDDIYTTADTYSAVIRWKAHTVWDDVDREVNVAAQLVPDGRIRFYYDWGNDHTSVVEQRDKTIGISKGDGSTYHLCLRNGVGNLGNASAIEYIPYQIIHVDAGYSGPENGTRANPFNRVSEGYNAITRYGCLRLHGGHYTTAADVPITLRKTIDVGSYDGTAVVGK